MKFAQFTAAIGLSAVAFVPMLLPLALLSPGFTHVARMELRLEASPFGVMVQERSWSILWEKAPHAYGPVLAAQAAFLPVVQSDLTPPTNYVVSVLELRTAAGNYYPFQNALASLQPSYLRAASSDVAEMTIQINRFVEHPSKDSLVLARRNPFPIAVAMFGALGTALAIFIARYWTVPLCRSAYRRIRGAPSQQAAEPLLQVLDNFVNLIVRLGSRR